MSLKSWWRGLREQNRRDTDERARMVSLLALRDAFIAVMLLIGAMVILPTILGGFGTNAATGDILVFFPLAAIFVAGGVIAISAALRGGLGFSSGSATYRSAWMLFGVLVGVGIVAALSLLGIGPPLSEAWSSVLGVMSGFLIGAVIWILVSRRNQ